MASDGVDDSGEVAVDSLDVATVLWVSTTTCHRHIKLCPTRAETERFHPLSERYEHILTAIYRENNLTTQTVFSKSTTLTQKTSSTQLIVSDMSSLRRVWSVCDWQNPTGSPSVVWLPVNSNARAVGHTSCLAFRKSLNVMRSSKESVNILGLYPASWIQYNTKYLHEMQEAETSQSAGIIFTHWLFLSPKVHQKFGPETATWTFLYLNFVSSDNDIQQNSRNKK